MWGSILGILSSGLGIVLRFIGLKNTPGMIKADQMSKNNEKLEAFDTDEALAAKGDKDALERIRAGIRRTP